MQTDIQTYRRANNPQSYRYADMTDIQTYRPQTYRHTTFRRTNRPETYRYADRYTDTLKRGQIDHKHTDVQTYIQIDKHRIFSRKTLHDLMPCIKVKSCMKDKPLNLSST